MNFYKSNMKNTTLALLPASVVAVRALLRTGKPNSKARRLLVICCAAAIVVILRRLRRMQALSPSIGLAEQRRRALSRFEQQRRRAIDHSKQWIDQRVTSWRHVGARVRASMAHRVEQQVEAALNRARSHLGGRLKDPDMPRALQRAVDAVLDGLLPDIKHESYRVLDEHLTFLQAYELQPHGADDTSDNFSPLSPRRSSTRSPRPFVQLLRRMRAAALHTLWPHDCSVWASLRSPGWWVLQALGVAPLGVGSTCWLLLAFAVDKQDEYQLCQFIVALRSGHFFTLGVFATLYGARMALSPPPCHPTPLASHLSERALLPPSALGITYRLHPIVSLRHRGTCR